MWTIANVSEFQSASAAWQCAADRASASVLLGTDFIGALLRAFGSGNELLAIYEGSGGPEAASIVHSLKPGIWMTFGPMEACLGAWIQSPDADVASLACALMRKLPRVPLILAITKQDPILLPRPVDQDRTRTLDYFKTARVDIDGSFDTYWSARGKNLRTNIRKARAELTRTGNEARLEIITRAADVRTAIAHFARLEASGWKGREGTAIQLENPQGRFYIDLLERACEKGIGRIYRYWFDDQPAAMDLCIRDGDSLVVLKTAYDEAHARVSPASLMREEQCRLCFAEGSVRRIEFYGPVMEWHTRWTQETRTMYHINQYRYGWLPKLHQSFRGRGAGSAIRSAE